MNSYTTDSIHIAATLLSFGYEPEIEMVTEKKASFTFELTEDLQDKTRRYNLHGEDALLVRPQDLFNAWTSIRGKIAEVPRRIQVTGSIQKKMDRISNLI